MNPLNKNLSTLVVVFGAVAAILVIRKIIK
jgi:hypothetical protein